MAKQSGLGDNFYISGVDLSGDVGTITSIRDHGALLDVTAIDKSAHERIPGIADGEMTFATFFNDATGKEHETLRNFGGSDKIVTYMRGTTVGGYGAALVGKIGNYAMVRGANGSIGFTIPVMSSNGDGLRWGSQLTAGIRTDTGATNGTSVDEGAATSFGAVLFLHVTAFSGTDVTISLEDSANNSAWSALSGASFTAVTAAPTSERIALATNATVRRYLRAVTATSGGFTSVSFAVLACRRYAAF